MGEMDGDGLKLWQLMPFHQLNVLVEPGMTTSEGANRQRAEGEARRLAAHSGEAWRIRLGRLVHAPQGPRLLWLRQEGEQIAAVDAAHAGGLCQP